MKHPKPLHTLRPASTRAKRRVASRGRKAEPAREYPPGYFTAPVVAWKQMAWQPGYWQQRADAYVRQANPMAPTLNQGRVPINMTLERERRAREGEGWGSATLALPGTPSWRANPLDWINRHMPGAKAMP